MKQKLHVGACICFMAFFMLQGCGNVCKTEISTCPSGATVPQPDSDARCTYEALTYTCGGCVNYTRAFGKTQCYNRSSGECESDCDGKCKECSVAYFKAGAICLEFRNDPTGCAKKNCGYYLAATYPGQQ